MTSAATARIWFVDTATWLSMAVDEAIAAAVLEVMGGDHVVVIDVVSDELDYRATVQGTATLAETAARTRPATWGDMDSARYVSLGEVLDAQWDVADGRTLTDERQHWAESTIIALGRKSAAAGFTSVKVLMSEDYEARRVAAGVPNMTAVSIHGLLHHLVHVRKTMTLARAAELADLLHDAERGPRVSAEDFADPMGRGLGRVGQPRPLL